MLITLIIVPIIGIITIMIVGEKVKDIYRIALITTIIN